MNRLILALCTILLTACGAPQPPPFRFPPSARNWTLKQARDLAPADAPEPLRRLGVKHAQAAEYEGAGRIAAQAYEMTSPAAAFEAEQQWRPQADTVAFHRDGYFFVIHWENADRSAVSAFVRDMEQRLPR